MVTAIDRLNQAAAVLKPAQGIHYHGSLTAGSATLDGDFKVTANGSTSASVDWNTDQAQLIAVGANIFVKSDVNYWTSTVGYFPVGASNTVDPTRWGRRSPTALPFDFQRYLSPPALAASMRGKNKAGIASTATTTLGRTKALTVTTGGIVYYLTADGDARLLKIENNGYPGYQLTVDPAGGADAVTELQSQITRLNTSFDTTATITTGKFSDPGYAPTYATATMTIKVSRTDNLPQTPVTATFEFDKDNPSRDKIDQCTATATPGLDNSAQLSCTVADTAWTSFTSGVTSTTIIYLKAAAFTTLGATNDEIQAMLKELTSPSHTPATNT
jgi:hypothetical protein